MKPATIARRHPSASPPPTGTSLVDIARRAPKLTQAEERALLERWQNQRDRKAADALARCNMRHVVAVAFRHRRYNVPIDVLISEGNLGMVRAMDKFDLDQNIRFSTYATYWIRYYVIDYIMRSWSVVGGGSGALKTRLFFRLRRERARAWSLHGDGEVADAVVAERLEMSPQRLSTLLRQLDQRDLSLNLPLKDGSSLTLQDTLADGASQENELIARQTAHDVGPLLERAMAHLNERERIIVQHRLLADAEDAHSLAKLGEAFGVSRERVRQLEEALKLKLRKTLVEYARVADLGVHDMNGAAA